MATYLVTGGAGFIGANLVHALLEQGDDVRVLDDFSTGRKENLADVRAQVDCVEGSILDRDLLAETMTGVDYCLHQAALPSVPRSVKDPWTSNRTNVEGALNVFLAARDTGVKRTVFASSSSVYGNAHPMPLREDMTPAPRSPYAITKATDEHYARVFSDLYDCSLVGLRYFNVFGPRQDPASQYAAVVPIFMGHMLRNEQPPVHGDGQQARDFCYIDNVVHANLAAATCPNPLHGVFNIACGESHAVTDLVDHLNELIGTDLRPAFTDARPGDIRQSWADITRAHDAFGYTPSVRLCEGLEKTLQWFKEKEFTP
jgi:UDP-glucose 4-epimerase